MSKLNIQLCPETGICSIIKADGQKVDLMPNEIGEVRDASGEAETIKRVLDEVDSGFAAALTPEELQQLSATFKKK